MIKSIQEYLREYAIAIGVAFQIDHLCLDQSRISDAARYYLLHPEHHWNARAIMLDFLFESFVDCLSDTPPGTEICELMKQVVKQCISNSFDRETIRAYLESSDTSVRVFRNWLISHFGDIQLPSSVWLCANESLELKLRRDGGEGAV